MKQPFKKEVEGKGRCTGAEPKNLSRNSSASDLSESSGTYLLLESPSGP